MKLRDRSWGGWFAVISVAVGCAEVRFPEDDDAGGDETCGATSRCGEACCEPGERCASNEVTGEVACTDSPVPCESDGATCTPEMSADGMPTNAGCCNARHTCFPIGGDGTVGGCYYVAPEGACAPSEARCTPELNEDGLATRGDCCLSRQTCFPAGDGTFGFCAY